MRQAKILYNNLFCGLLTETDDGTFTFQYDEEYLNRHPSQFITFTMPVRKSIRISAYLHFLKV
ncbi:HipA N-terminal domain-containing protein [Salegentibacter salinarum]|nr:HipA N-terminal domain-containing protein [Salegentibacter salinarum]